MSSPVLPGKWESHCKPEKKINILLIGTARLWQRWEQRLAGRQKALMPFHGLLQSFIKLPFNKTWRQWSWHLISALEMKHLEGKQWVWLMGFHWGGFFGANLPFGAFLWEEYCLGVMITEPELQSTAISLQCVGELCTPPHRLHTQHYLLHTGELFIISQFLLCSSKIISSFSHTLPFPVCNSMSVCNVIQETFKVSLCLTPKLSFLAKSNPFLLVTWFEVVC